MDDYSDFAADDFFETHDIDDLMEWETEQVFQDSIAERNEYDSACDYDFDDCEDCDECE